MLIMNSRKMIYVHLQKCGGTSIEQAFWEHARWDDILLGSSQMGEFIQWEYFGEFQLFKHSVAKEVISVIGAEVWERYYSWATVRNPYTRIASLYNFTQAQVEEYAGAANFPLGVSVAEQAAWARRPDYPDREPWNYSAVRAYLRNLDAPCPFGAFLADPELENDSAYSPQWWGLQDKAGARLAVSEVVKLEELGAAWPRICEKIGLPGIHLRHVNVSNPRVPRKTNELFRSPEDIALVQRRFHEDFDRFGYDPNVIP